jgi:hypothetical protein
MHVRPLRLTATRTRTERRPHVFGRPDAVETPADVAAAAPPAPAPVASAPVADTEHAAERRHRACVAPEDRALYSCSCGFQFQAPVSTSVACPHCGTAQAW